MSNTPLTDKAVIAYQQRHWGNGGLGSPTTEPKAVHADFARTLELELVELLDAFNKLGESRSMIHPRLSQAITKASNLVNKAPSALEGDAS